MNEKNSKKIKKASKIILVVVVLFSIYLLIGFVKFIALVPKLVDAINKDDINRIYELTGENFEKVYSYSVDGTKNIEKQSVYDVIENNGNISAFLCDEKLKSFSIELTNIEIEWPVVSYKMIVKMSDPQKICSSGENINKFISNNEDALFVATMRGILLKENEHLLTAIKTNIYLDDSECSEENYYRYETSIDYNLLNHSFSGTRALIEKQKGFDHNMYVHTELTHKSSLTTIERIEFFNEDGSTLSLDFYKNNFIRINTDNEEYSNYINENKLSREEIFNFLEEEAYFHNVEQIMFCKPAESQVVEVTFYEGKFIYCTNSEIRNQLLKDELTKEEVLTILESNNFIQVKEIMSFKKWPGGSLNLFFKEDELIFMHGYNDKEILEVITKNNYNKEEIINYLIKTGYEKMNAE